MTAEIIRLDDYRKQVSRPNQLKDALDRWETAAYCGNVTAMLRAQCDYFEALFGGWPNMIETATLEDAEEALSDKPCDTE